MRSILPAGHPMHQIGNKGPLCRLLVHPMHRIGSEVALDRRYGHAVHTTRAAPLHSPQRAAITSISTE